MSFLEAVDVVWLRQLSPALQDRYFEARQRSYCDVWGRRGVAIVDGIGLRDEFDDGEVVAAIDHHANIVGGVRANVVRPASGAAAKSLPMEKRWNISVRRIYPDHDLDRVSYAEASRLFLCNEGNWMQAAALKLRLLNYLLENVPAVGVTYFVVPATLVRSYHLLARHKSIDYDFRVVEGLHPNASTRGDKPTRWGVFACLHTKP